MGYGEWAAILYEHINKYRSSGHWIFIALFIVACAFSLKSRKILSFPHVPTAELKGFAILAIVFSHIGYFLVTDDRFLFPLTIFAGVGVNLFLFLSGYGLTLSKMKSEETLWQFYKKRLPIVLLPFWVALVAILITDFFVLGISYPTSSIIQNFSGIFIFICNTT